MDPIGNAAGACSGFLQRLERPFRGCFLAVVCLGPVIIGNNNFFYAFRLRLAGNETPNSHSGDGRMEDHRGTIPTPHFHSHSADKVRPFKARRPSQPPGYLCDINTTSISIQHDGGKH